MCCLANTKDVGAFLSLLGRVSGRVFSSLVSFFLFVPSLILQTDGKFISNPLLAAAPGPDDCRD